MKSIITQLTKTAIEAKKENKDIIDDIILFGSTIRGKEKPNDIDLLILTKIKIKKETEHKIRKKFQKENKNINIISKTKETINEEAFDARDSIKFEGYSLLNKEYIAKKEGFTPLGMIIYQTKSLKNTTKTRFYYALNGRGNSKGIADENKIIKISDNVILVPVENIEKIKEFFEFWNIEYKYVPLLLPTRMSKKEILEKL